MPKISQTPFYKGSDAHLLALKAKTARLVHQINQAHPDKRDEIHATLLPTLFFKLGQNSWFEFPLNIDYGINTKIGKNCYFNHHLTINDGASVRIGDHVIIGPNVGIYTSEHPLDSNLRKEGWQTDLPITIGNNVFIGAGSIILSGVTIHDNAVIGAGSVVTKDIPANALAYGNPARVIKILS